MQRGEGKEEMESNIANWTDNNRLLRNLSTIEIVRYLVEISLFKWRTFEAQNLLHTPRLIQKVFQKFVQLTEDLSNIVQQPQFAKVCSYILRFSIPKL